MESQEYNPRSFIQFWDFIAYVSLFTFTITLLAFGKWKSSKRSCNERIKRIAFYHPYCNAGGGGERVLWTAIRALQDNHYRSGYEYYIYTGDSDTIESIIKKVKICFGIELISVPKLVYLRWRPLLEAKYYPVFTLLLQSFGSALLGIECFIKLRPDILIDTTGHAFIYPIFYFGGCSVVSYTHYPTISTDMLLRVSERYEAHNNRRIIAGSRFLSSIKIWYYRLFACIYGHVGRYAIVVMVNSSWTRDHIQKIWKCPEKLNIVYPPCNTKAFAGLVKLPPNDNPLISIISIGQFRPEKNYPLQLKAFSQLIKCEPKANLELVLIGGVRNVEDEERVSFLKNMADELCISDKVRWCINAPFSDLLNEVQNGTIGLHTMWNEHFGISVVECMAGGLIMIAHDSGGPKADIVVKWDNIETGFLADSVESYVEQMKKVLHLSDEQLLNIRRAARSSITRFSEELFSINFIKAMSRASLLTPITS